MKKIYIAGPYTSHLETDADRYFEIGEHIMAAEHVAIELANRQMGFMCPHTHTAHFEDKANAPESFYIELDMDMLEMCQAIVMVDGWEKSSGSRKEHAWAKEHGLEIFFDGEYAAIEEWYNEVSVGGSGTAEAIHDQGHLD